MPWFICWIRSRTSSFQSTVSNRSTWVTLDQSFSLSWAYFIGLLWKKNRMEHHVYFLEILNKRQDTNIIKYITSLLLDQCVYQGCCWIQWYKWSSYSKFIGLAWKNSKVGNRGYEMFRGGEICISERKYLRQWRLVGERKSYQDWQPWWNWAGWWEGRRETSGCESPQGSQEVCSLIGFGFLFQLFH